MSGFFSRLLARAAGDAGPSRVRPQVAPPWAAGAGEALGESLELEASMPAEPPPRGAAAQVVQGAHTRPAGEADRGDAAPFEVEHGASTPRPPTAPPRATASPAPMPPALQPAVPSPRLPARPAMPQAPTRAAVPSLPPARLQAETSRVDEASQAAEAAAASAETASPKRPRTAAVAPVAIAARQAARPAAPSPAAPRDEGTVVHVSIGRVELFAPAAAPAVRAPRTAPRGGSVPLADYLRGKPR
ncbi:MAG: hypothetical protein JNM33_17520 [Rubrivivax sp.]|nr:hypothetical protein [Rubrivivax sp.]